MKLRTITSTAAAVALGAALLVPAAAEAAPVHDAGASSEQGITRVQNGDGSGVVMNSPSALRFGWNDYKRVEHPAGGTWEYGNTHGTYSNFQHGTRKHGSTAKNGEGNSQRLANIAGGKWSNASIKKTAADNQAYYHFD